MVLGEVSGNGLEFNYPKRHEVMESFVLGDSRASQEVVVQYPAFRAWVRVRP